MLTQPFLKQMSVTGCYYMALSMYGPNLLHQQLSTYYKTTMELLGQHIITADFYVHNPVVVYNQFHKNPVSTVEFLKPEELEAVWDDIKESAHLYAHIAGKHFVAALGPVHSVADVAYDSNPKFTEKLGCQVSSYRCLR